MKTLVIFLVLALASVMGNAQGVIELNEARINYNPLGSQITEVGNHFSYTVKEKFSGEFQNNPMAFVKEYFDIHQFIKEVADRGYSSYQVSFVTRKGELLAEYNKIGELVNTFQKFENVALPNAVCHQIFRENQGWTMVKNQHIAKGKNGLLTHNFYKITMKKGNKKKNFKIEIPSSEGLAFLQK